MKFSVGYQLPDEYDSTAELVEDYLEHISSVYFSAPGQASARSAIEAEAHSDMMEELRIVEADEYNLEIFHKDAGKGNALMRLAQHLGIDPAQTMAVGDSDNDASMIRAAGLGLAMSNACA